MNKVLLSLAAVTGLAGGAYLMLPADKDLNLMQYVPEPIAGFFDKEAVEPEIIQSPVSQAALNEAPIQEITISQEDVVVIPDEVVEEVQDVVKQDEEVNVVPVISNETLQEEVNESGSITSEALNARALISKNKKPSTNKAELEGQLQEMNTSISKLDDENQALQLKFKKMLQKNKELAMKLSQMEQQISAVN